jgi:hypothetical protein
MTGVSAWHSGRAAVAKCLFCGALGVWWDCHCEPARKIAEGKLPRPRTVMRGGIPIIECCAELREAAARAGVMRMAPDPVTLTEAPSVTSVITSVTSVTPVTLPDEGAEDRSRRLTRERVARYRAKD